MDTPEAAHGGEKASADPAQTPPANAKNALTRLQESYKEVLDATKHQDDKVGRIFTGVAFLTASALAIANLNSSKLLLRQYSDIPGISLAVVSLGIYLILVIICVTLLISSLATPLRVPGLENRRATEKLGPSWVAGVRASQIYFSHIARLSIADWNKKWDAIAHDCSAAPDEELRQSLVLETHNLAVRTQFKSNRTSEAVVIFKFALMFLAITVVLCIAASLTADPAKLPSTTRWGVGTVIGCYLFLHFQDQIRYSRQTIDEIRGGMNTAIAALRYGWAICATAWALFTGAGFGSVRFHVALVILGSALLLVSTYLERRRAGLARDKDRLHWVPPIIALVAGIGLSIQARGGSYLPAVVCSAGGATLITVFAIAVPTLQTWRTARRPVVVA